MTAQRLSTQPITLSEHTVGTGSQAFSTHARAATAASQLGTAGLAMAAVGHAAQVHCSPSWTGAQSSGSLQD